MASIDEKIRLEVSRQLGVGSHPGIDVPRNPIHEQQTGQLRINSVNGLAAKLADFEARLQALEP